jgi:DNA gyrase subunit A
VIKSGIKAFAMEDLIPDVQTVVMITRGGYIKRIPPETFRTQTRGGKGVTGLTTKEEDEVEQMFTTSTHRDILFFTNRGRVFKIKTYDIPEASRTAKGQALVNFLNLAPGETVSSYLSFSESDAYKFLFFVTSKGTVKKTSLDEFENIRTNGLIAIKLNDGDNLEWVKPTSGKDEISLVTNNGQSIRFEEDVVRPMGRSAAGVRGIRLKGSDVVIGMDVITPEMAKRKDQPQLLVLMENGLGKRTPIDEYKTQGRGGSGVRTAHVSAKTGKVIAAHIVDADDKRDLMVISSGGQVIRTSIKSVSVLGRDTQGVRVMRFKEEKDKAVSVTVVE